MKIVFYTNSISPHQLPWCNEFAELICSDEFVYVYTDELTEERRSLGWSDAVRDAPFRMVHIGDGAVREEIESCDVLLADLRDADLFKRRAEKKLITVYISERWFKPLGIGVGERCRCSLPGWVRMLVPRYRRMARGIADLLKKSSYFYYLPQGIHAARDMARLLDCSIESYEKRPCGKIAGRGDALNKLRIWGYFVAPSERKLKCEVEGEQRILSRTLKVLWCGRLLGWKRVEDIVRAVETVEGGRLKVGQRNISLTIVGDGPEKARLIKLAEKINFSVQLHTSTSTAPVITFVPPQPIEKIREFMRDHDLYIFSSNAYEGWGAVVSEAIEEELKVVGTHEAGATATILPETCLYHAGDYKSLAARIARYDELPRIGKTAWSAHTAAIELKKLIDEVVAHADN